MIKHALMSAAVLFTSLSAMATDLTPSNIIGRYNVTARAMGQVAYIKFHVTSTKEFEIQRTYPDGHSDETCNGTYNLNNSFIMNEYAILAASHTFNGVFTCPSDRSKKISFNIAFGNTTVEDLVKGTTVSVTTSMAPITLSAYVKKQP